MNTNIVGANIRRLREAMPWTQEELAISAGVDVRTVQRAESGRPLAVETLRAFAAAFNTTIEALSTSHETFAKLVEEIRGKYVVVPLDPVTQSSDVAAFFAGTDAYLLHRTRHLLGHSQGWASRVRFRTDVRCSSRTDKGVRLAVAAFTKLQYPIETGISAPKRDGV